MIQGLSPSSFTSAPLNNIDVTFDWDINGASLYNTGVGKGQNPSVEPERSSAPHSSRLLPTDSGEDARTMSHFENFRWRRIFNSLEKFCLTVGDEHASGEHEQESICWKWADGSEAEPAPPRHVVAESHDGDWELVQEGAGLRFVCWSTGKKDSVLLENTARFDSSKINYTSTSLRGDTLALFCRNIGGSDSAVALCGLWNSNDGRQVAQIPIDQDFHGFDPTGRWCVTSSKKELILWDSTSGE